MMKDCECSKAELDLFSVPPTNTSMESGYVIEHLPLSKPEDGPLEFDVTSPDDYVDLGRTFLYVKAKVTKDDKTEQDDDAKVGPVNLWLHSLFSQVDVQLNGKLVTPSVNTYPYKAYLETLLSYGNDAKESQLTSQLWYQDSGSVDSVDPHAEENHNPGFNERATHTNKSKSVELMGRLHCDIFQQDRYLLNKVDMHIKLVRSPETFHLMYHSDVKVKTVIEDAVLYVRKVRVNPTLSNQHNQLLSSGQLVQYPVRRGVVTTYTIPVGSMSDNKDNVITGQLPRRVVVGLVSNQAFNGAAGKNPYNFEHFKLNYLSLFAGGQQFPKKPLTPDFKNGLYLRSYLTLFEGTGMLNDDRGLTIDREDYKKGFTLYAFDLTPDMAEGAHTDPIKFGNVRMEIHFKAQLAKTVNVLVYAEYDNVIQIDRARTVMTDF